MRSSDGLTGCPGAGAKPAAASNTELAADTDQQGRAVCPRCGGRYALRADGRIRAHRVPAGDIVPMIRRQLDPAGRLRSGRA